MSSIKDIARQLGLSVSTVSRALNGKYGVHPQTREQVLRAAEELAYVPNTGAKELVSKRSNLVGVILPEIRGEAKAPFFELFPHISRSLKLYGLESIITTMDPHHYKLLDVQALWRTRNLQGLIVFPGIDTGHPLVPEISRLQVPTVFIGHHKPGRHHSSVHTHDVYGMELVMAHLAGAGHTEIGFINGPEHLPICQKRLEGYLRGIDDLRATGKDLTPCFLHSDFSGQGGGEAVLQMVAEHTRLTAVAFANDLMAMGAVSALQRAGVAVPERLSITGYDGLFIGEYFTPPLTSVMPDFQRMGIRMVELLIELIHGGQGRTESIRPVLVERTSTTRPDSGRDSL